MIWSSIHSVVLASTGMVAENLNRRWVCFEMMEDYLKGAKIRFDAETRETSKDQQRCMKSSRRVHSPISMTLPHVDKSKPTLKGLI